MKGPPIAVSPEQLCNFPTEEESEHLGGVELYPIAAVNYRLFCHSREYVRVHYSRDKKEEDGLIVRHSEPCYCFMD